MKNLLPMGGGVGSWEKERSLGRELRRTGLLKTAGSPPEAGVGVGYGRCKLCRGSLARFEVGERTRATPRKKEAVKVEWLTRDWD